ncbi:MAG: hypothetical protein AVO39_03980 [delta proteobacterium MLS_D]|jgi:phosphopantetheinyl transferase (holo-ACP synthase)|nr:MAG: hypothetical protein AVO39_03980 [delta proteobacterium MLS_D]
MTRRVSSSTALPYFPVGNDIVDRADPEAAKKHLNGRFVSRVLTKREKRLFDESADPGLMLWSFWAAKETAYKIFSRIDRDISAWPRLYETYFQNTPGVNQPVTGRVVSGGMAATILLTPAADYVHCLGTAGTADDLTTIMYGLYRLPGPARGFRKLSRRVRNSLRESVAEETNVHIDRVHIVREKGPRGLLPPILVIDGKPAAACISISHDGSFAAFARTPLPHI